MSSHTQDEDDEVESAVIMPLVLGAPIEKVNPLGNHVTLFSAVMLNIGQIIGSGIFSIPGVILKSVGSVGLFFLAWILAPVIAFAGLMLYGELAAMFPNRSGAEAVYLEQAYPKPRFLVPLAFAICSVMLSQSAMNALVFAQYVLDAFDAPISGFNQTILAVALCTVSTFTAAVSTKWSLKLVNVTSIFKVLVLVWAAGVGFFVLVGGTSIEDPFANYRNMFEGSTLNPNALATALVKANMTFFGWQNVFNVLGEVKSKDPARLARRAGYISIAVIAALYFFTNVAYVAVIPRDEMAASGQLVAALFFRRLFGESIAARVPPYLVAASCFGNMVAVTVGHARLIREIARQGLLPYPRFFASTKPFGTPFGPILLKYTLTVLLILVLPAKDAFNFIADLWSYPALVFTVATIVGVWILRKRTAAAGFPPPGYRAWTSAILLYLFFSIILLVLPWVPPEPGHADVSFWYATYCVAGISILLLCGLYYYIWMVLLPKWGGYEIIEEVEELSDGARTAHLTRLYKKQTRTGEEQALLGD